MKVIMLRPGETATIEEIKNDLKSMQEVVGGHIQAVYPFSDEVAIVCNDEGKLEGLEPCRGLRYPDTGEMYDFLAGTCFICGLTEEDFGDVPEHLIQKYFEMFKDPEYLVKTAYGYDMIRSPEDLLTFGQ